MIDLEAIEVMIADKKQRYGKSWNIYTHATVESLVAEIKSLRSQLHDSRMCEPEFPETFTNSHEGTKT